MADMHTIIKKMARWPWLEILSPLWVPGCLAAVLVISVVLLPLMIALVVAIMDFTVVIELLEFVLDKPEKSR